MRAVPSLCPATTEGVQPTSGQAVQNSPSTLGVKEPFAIQSPAGSPRACACVVAVGGGGAMLRSVITENVTHRQR